MRNPAWALDRVERLTRKNALAPSGMFKFDAGGTVYSRAEGLMSGTGMIGYALNAVREAVFDPHHDRLLRVRFETLIADPAKALTAIYDFVGLPEFVPDFEHIEPDYDAMLFDARIGSPGLHAVGSRVHHPPRRTCCPPTCSTIRSKTGLAPAGWFAVPASNGVIRRSLTARPLDIPPFPPLLRRNHGSQRPEPPGAWIWTAPTSHRESPN